MYLPAFNAIFLPKNRHGETRSSFITEYNEKAIKRSGSHNIRLVRTPILQASKNVSFIFLSGLLKIADFWQGHSAVQNHIEHPKRYHKIVRQPPLNLFLQGLFRRKINFPKPSDSLMQNTSRHSLPVLAFRGSDGDELSRKGGREMYSPRLQRKL